MVSLPCSLGCRGVFAVFYEGLTIASVGVLLLACLAVGGLFPILTANSRVSAWERILFDLLLGIGSLSILFLLLAALSFLHWWLLWGLLLTVLAFRSGPLTERLAKMAALVRQTDRTGISALSAGTTVIFGTFVMMLSLLPPSNWDSLMYHLEIPKKMLQSGHINLTADNQHDAFIGVMHMLFLPLLAVGLHSGPQVLNAALAVVLAVSVGLIGSHLFERRTGELSAATFWGSTTILVVAVTARIDVSLALFLIVGHYAAMRAMEEDAPPKLLVISGLILGFACGTKYHAGLYTAGVLLVVVPVAAARPKLVRPLLMGLAAGSVVLLPWLVRNQLIFQDPVYPFMAAPRLPHWLVSVAGQVTVPDRVPRSAFHVLGTIRNRLNLRDLIFSPGSLTSEGEGALYFFNIIFCFLPLMFVIRRRSTVIKMLIPPAIYLVCLMVVSRKTSLRYIIPMFPACTIAAAEGLRQLRNGPGILSESRPSQPVWCWCRPLW